jgi:lysophospholipid acyltransferase (LPLAT)-like uncharacterized protein
MNDSAVDSGKSFWTRYSVGEVPKAWKPIYWMYSICLAAAMFLYFRIVCATSRITVQGRESLDVESDYFLSCWHDSFPTYLATCPRHVGHVWMVFSAWYMRPMHILALWSGVEDLVFGATGHDGKQAAGRLVAKLGSGHSTVFLPDGPFCNPREPRKGILFMARDSGLAIIPMKVATSRAMHLPTWDRKVIPLPFSRIEIQYGNPIRVSEVNKDTLETLRVSL